MASPPQVGALVSKSPQRRGAPPTRTAKKRRADKIKGKEEPIATHTVEFEPVQFSIGGRQFTIASRTSLPSYTLSSMYRLAADEAYRDLRANALPRYKRILLGHACLQVLEKKYKMALGCACSSRL